MSQAGPGAGAGPFRTLAAFAASGLVATGLQFALRLGKNVLFTRLLGPEGRGLYSLVMTVPTLVVGLGNLGFGLGTLYLATREKADPRRLVGNALAYALVQGSVLFLVGLGLFALEGRGWFVMDGAGRITGAVLASIPLCLLYNLGIDLLTARTDIHFLNFTRLVFSLLPVGLLLGWYAATGDAVTAALASWPASLGAVGVLAFGRLLVRGGWPLRLSAPLAGRAFRFGLRGAVGQFANSVARRVDVLFLAHYWDAGVVGQYAAAVSLAEILLALPEAVSTPFLPMRLGMAEAEGRHFSTRVLKYVVAVMAAVCLVTALGAKPAIWLLFGRDFSPSLVPLLWLLPGVLALAVYDLAKADVLGLGRPGLLSLVSLGTMLLNLGLNALIIPVYGASGAAFCSSVSYAASSAALLLFLSRASGTPLRALLLPRPDEVGVLWRTIMDRFGRRRG